jgi:hypothetical protein
MKDSQDERKVNRKKRRMKEGMKEEQESAFTNQYCS